MKRTSRARLFEDLAVQSRHDEAERIMHRAEPVAEKLDDYFVIIKRWARLPTHHRTRWTWEIQRRSKPLPVKYNGNDFATPQDARLAGERALKELLHNLSQRQNAPLRKISGSAGGGGAI